MKFFKVFTAIVVASIFLAACNSLEETHEENTEKTVTNEKYGYQIIVEDDYDVSEASETTSPESFVPISSQCVNTTNYTFICVDVFNKGTMDTSDSSSQLEQGTSDYWFSTTVITGQRYDYRITASHEDKEVVEEKAAEFLDNFKLLKGY